MKHLRRIIGIYYPRKISNDDLYKKCNMIELETTIRNARWRMFGHTLRMNDDKAAKRATFHYFDHIANGFQCKPRHTLPHMFWHHRCPFWLEEGFVHRRNTQLRPYDQQNQVFVQSLNVCSVLDA